MANAKWDGKRWRLRITINGQLRSFSSSVSGRRGREEVERRAQECSRLTELTDFTTAWKRYIRELTAFTSPEHVKNTESVYRNYFGSIADRKLTDMKYMDYQDVILNARKKDGSELSKKSLQNIRAVLVNFSKFCKRNGLMTETLTELRVPKAAPKKGKEILQPDQVRSLMNDFNDEWYINLWRWLVCTGMRPGEGLALRWSDIEGDRVTIRQSMNYRGRMTDCKNQNARRNVFLNSVLVDILRNQKEKTWRLNSEYIFCNHAGQCAKQTDTIHSWGRISHSLGSKTSPYGLRHTFVSLMAQTLPEASLKEWIGHSASMNTYGVYGHAVNGQGQETASRIGISLLPVIKSQ